jgi:hypothetical protein
LVYILVRLLLYQHIFCTIEAHALDLCCSCATNSIFFVCQIVRALQKEDFLLRQHRVRRCLVV